MIATFLMLCAMVTHDARIELRNAPTTVNLNLGGARAKVLAVARDPKRHLMLHVEGISVQGEVGMWEVRVGDHVAGTLSTYGAEEAKGKYAVSVVMDEAVERALRGGAKTLGITFAPTARVSGTIRFTRLRLVGE